MADIKQVFNDEVRRLARKEVKLAVVPLVKLVAEQKQMIRELKRELAAVKKDMPVKEEPVQIIEVAEDDDKKYRLNAAGIIRIRTKLDLTQGKFAALLGVSTHTVSMWELDKVSPRTNMKKRICQLRTMGKRELKKHLEMLEDTESEKQQ